MPTTNPEKLKAKRHRWYVKYRDQILDANATTKADQIRNAHLVRKFGLTLEQWEKKFDEQGRKCASCPATESGSRYGWHTDHDHKTGRFRGILCRACNIALGLVEDDVEHLKFLIAYLERTSDA